MTDLFQWLVIFMLACWCAWNTMDIGVAHSRLTSLLENDYDD